MTKNELKRFNDQYASHLRILKLQGKAEKTIESYSRAVRRLRDHFDCCPDKVPPKQLEIYFSYLVDTKSWSTVKVDRLGLMFFWKHVLKKDWEWLNIIKPPQIHTLPDILSIAEIEKIIGSTRKMRYRIFLLTTYSMGLRLEEALSLQVSDIDAANNRIHVRRGKGHKDRFVPLPDLTYQGLRALWKKHQHPEFLFPNANGSPETIQKAKNHMDRGGTQNAMKKVVEECGIKKKSLYIHFDTHLQHISLKRV